MPPMYNTVIALADKYNIPDDLLDIIFMYINRNMIKSCTDKFMNKDFIRNMDRILLKSDTYCDIRARVQYNPGRVMIKLLYPKSLNSELNPIEYRINTTHRNVSKFKVNMLLWRTVEDGGWNHLGRRPLHHIQGNQKVYVEVDQVAMDELTNGIYYSCDCRKDLINIIDHKQQLDKVYNDIPYIQYKRNMKTQKYVDMLIPKICLSRNRE
jgi:hypothetical protein